MSKIAEWIRHNQGVFVALIILAGIAVWTFGCPSKVTSLIDPVKMVTVEELELEIEEESLRLQAELDSLIRRAKVKQAELARQDAIKQKLFDFAAITIDGGTVNPAGLAGLLFSILGVGAVVDNRLKDKVIKNRPLKPVPPAE